VLAGVLIVGLDVVIFQPRMPESMIAAGRKATAWHSLLASFYGGINEEILLRLFAVSGIALSRINNGVATELIFWAAIVLAAILFGIGHLPATARLAPLTPLLIVRALLLNGIAGILAGYLYWRYGLETAMIAHFSADIVLHVLPPLFVKNRDLTSAVQGS
jgi:membrane protease YdiL (CAAX protease family)